MFLTENMFKSTTITSTMLNEHTNHSQHCMYMYLEWGHLIIRNTIVNEDTRAELTQQPNPNTQRNLTHNVI